MHKERRDNSQQYDGQDYDCYSEMPELHVRKENLSQNGPALACEGIEYA